MHSPTAREEETKAAISRPTFRFAPHNDRTTADLSSDPMATADEEKSGTALRLKTNLQPEIPARTDSIIAPPAKAEKEDLHSASNHCSLCLITSPILCPRHRTGDNKPDVDAQTSTVLSTNHHRRKQSSDTATKSASQTAPTKDAKKTPKTVQQPRTHEECQERAYIASSRRTDRSIEVRMESARMASVMHRKRTGRGLRITQQAVLDDDLYEEEDNDLLRYVPTLSIPRRKGSVGSSTNKDSTSSPLSTRRGPNAEIPAKTQPTLSLSSKSSDDSSGRGTPGSVHEHPKKEEEFMPKRAGNEGSVMLNVVNSSPEKIEEPGFKTRDRLLIEIGNLRLEQTKDRLKQEREAEIARRAIPPKPVEQEARPAEWSQKDLKVGRTKLSEEALRVIDEEIERQRQLRKARKPVSAVHFKLVEKSGGVVLEDVAAGEARKRLVEISGKKKEEDANEVSTDLDDEISRLEKEKVVTKLRTELAESTEEKMAALARVRQKEADKLYDTLGLLAIFVAGSLVFCMILLLLVLVLLMLWDMIRSVWKGMR